MASAGNLENNNFKIPSIFGNKATYKTTPDKIPTTTPAGSIKASWQDGFPALTFDPNNAPSGADFNGLFGLLSGLLMNTQMGQMINTYDATYQVNIGGYPNGAIIWFVPNSESPNPDWSNRMLFQSTADGNTEVPFDTVNQTVGSGWKQLLPVVQNIGITETYVNGTSWYRKYSDGWIEQGGVSSGSGTNKPYIINFVNPPLAIGATAQGYVQQSVIGITARNTSFDIAWVDNGNGAWKNPSFWWWAKGY